MIKPQDYSELVEDAAKGNKEALSKLAEMVYGSLRSYVLRITLSEDVTDEIVQGTIVEMYKIFGQLKNKDSFWPWLCKIALNKVRTNSAKQTRQRHLLEKHAEELSNQKINLEGLTNAINKEIKQAIFQAMSKLNDQQKAVLSLRCFENLSFNKIAYVMDLSEFNSRIIFHRAKKKLQKHLCKSGFTKKNLLPALIIFGKLTAPSEAAASTISVTPAILSTGGIATAVATATTRTAMIVTAGTAIGIGVTAKTAITNTGNPNQNLQAVSISAAEFTPVESGISIEGYYFYPDGSGGPVMTRLKTSSGNGTCKILQNDHGNYIQKDSGSGVILQNQHYWNRDLSVMTLPTDTKQFSELLGRKNFGWTNMPAGFRKTPNLLFAADKNEKTDTIDLSVHKFDAMMEESFQYNWPAGTTIIDQRDDIHKQGWCHFTMKGIFRDQKIAGYGKIPFTYVAGKKIPAEMTVNIGNDTAIFVNKNRAILQTENKILTSYPPGSFFVGMNKPWMGLHVIDTIRRDAALTGIPFRTELFSKNSKCKISLLHKNTLIEYIIDMERDLIDEISFLDEYGLPIGQISFEYFTAKPENHINLKLPDTNKSPDSSKTNIIYWPAELVSQGL